MVATRSAIAIGMLALTGCTSWPEPDILNSGRGVVTTAGSTQVIGPGQLEPISLPAIIIETAVEGRYRVTNRQGDGGGVVEIDPVSILAQSNGTSADNDCLRSSTGSTASTIRLSDDAGGTMQAISIFNKCVPENQRAERRNRVQDFILAGADRRCAVYRSYITQIANTTNFGFGALTTILAGMGGILTHATTARALSGAAGITSGIGAEYNESFFKQQTLSVIFSGINMARQEVHQDIENRRTGTKNSISSYTLEGAIKDGIRYNEACSVSAGLDKVATELAKNGQGTSLDAAERTLAQIQRLNARTTLANSGSTPKQLADANAQLLTFELPAKIGALNKQQKIRLAQLRGLANAESLSCDTATDAQLNVFVKNMIDELPSMNATDVGALAGQITQVSVVPECPAPAKQPTPPAPVSPATPGAPATPAAPATGSPLQLTPGQQGLKDRFDKLAIAQQAAAAKLMLHPTGEFSCKMFKDNEDKEKAAVHSKIATTAPAEIGTIGGQLDHAAANPLNGPCS